MGGLVGGMVGGLVGGRRRCYVMARPPTLSVWPLCVAPPLPPPPPSFILFTSSSSLSLFLLFFFFLVYFVIFFLSLSPILYFSCSHILCLHIPPSHIHSLVSHYLLPLLSSPHHFHILPFLFFLIHF